MFYQQNPVFSIVILLIFIGLYLFFKSRKRRGMPGHRGGLFFSGRQPYQNTNMDDLITLVMLQQLFDKPNGINSAHNKDTLNNKNDEIDRTKKEILQLLEE